MTKKMLLKRNVILGVFVLFCAQGVSAIEWAGYPPCLKKGDLIFNGGLDLGSGSAWTSTSATMVGFSASADALMGGGLSAGIETGFRYGSATYFSFTKLEVTDVGLGVIPIGIRVGYHTNFIPKAKNLDLYGVVKFIVNIGFATEEIFEGKKVKINTGVGFDLGARYFFKPNFGAYLEGGYDFSFGSGALYTKFLTVGVTFKKGGLIFKEDEKKKK
jgi:hypothetical protein